MNLSTWMILTSLFQNLPRIANSLTRDQSPSAQKHLKNDSTIMMTFHVLPFVLYTITYILKERNSKFWYRIFPQPHYVSKGHTYFVLSPT